MRRRTEWLPLKLTPGGTYVIHVPGEITAERAARIREEMEYRDFQVIILDGGMHLAREPRRWWQR